MLHVTTALHEDIPHAHGCTADAKETARPICWTAVVGRKALASSITAAVTCQVPDLDHLQ